MKLADYIVNVPNFPIEGIQFKDITTLIGTGVAFHEAINEMAAFAKANGADLIVGPDARGFILGAPVAYALEKGFIPVRKVGKLPRKVIQIDYDLEYGKNTLCIHADAIQPGQKVVIIDDLLATGGTIEATIRLIEQAGGIVTGIGFLIELLELHGRDKIKDYPIKALIQY